MRKSSAFGPASQAHQPQQLRAERGRPQAKVTHPVGSTVVLRSHSNKTIAPLTKHRPSRPGRALIT